MLPWAGGSGTAFSRLGVHARCVFLYIMHGTRQEEDGRPKKKRKDVCWHGKKCPPQGMPWTLASIVSREKETKGQMTVHVK